ncbi:MAG: hypothetical protein A2Z34_08805, partial [Planctomycetes bacterium RBG_16_59_8]
WGADEVEVGIVERLGDSVPSDITLIDESGKAVTLREIADKPILLSLVYYNCPGLCTPLMNGIRQLLEETDELPGKEYTILTVSFNEEEKHELAARKKESYIASLRRPIAPEGWRFFTADAANIRRLTEAVGFRYKKVGQDFNHTAALTVIAPGGKIVRYLHGTTFLPFDLKMALTEAHEGRVGGSTTRTGSKLLLYCYSYDPESRRYTFNILKITATFSLLTVLSIAGFLVFRSKRRKPGKEGA